MIASERGEVGLAAGMALLRDGGSAMDAVEAAIRIVEANEDDHYVGVGGLPNLLGEVELDASIMDGATRRAGAVGAVKGFPHPISIARAVFDQLGQHLLLVGRGRRAVRRRGRHRARRDAHRDRPADVARRAGRRPAQPGRAGARRRRDRLPEGGAGAAAGDEAAVRPAGHGQRAGPGRQREPVRRGVDQRLPVEVPRPGGRLGADRRRATTATTGSAARPAPAAASWPSARTPPVGAAGAGGRAQPGGRLRRGAAAGRWSCPTSTGRACRRCA